MENANRQVPAAPAQAVQPAMMAMTARRTIVLMESVNSRLYVPPTTLRQTIVTKTAAPKIPARATMNASRNGYVKIMTIVPMIPALMVNAFTK